MTGLVCDYGNDTVMSIKNLSIEQENMKYAPKLVNEVVLAIWTHILCQEIFNEFAKRFLNEGA